MLQITLLIISILLSGVFSGSEIAFFSLGSAKVLAMIESKKKGARMVAKVKSDPDKLLIAILIGNNIVNIGSSALATFVATKAFGSTGVGIATGVMTLLILTFGEILPKSIAAKYAEKIAPVASYPIYGLMILLSPVILPFSLLLKGVNRLIGGDRTPAPVVTEEEVMAMTEIGFKEGVFEDHENDFIQNIFTLNDTKVSKAMTPKKKVVRIDGEKYISEIIKGILKKHYSRIPVYNKKIDNIVGFVITKDILGYPRSNWSKIKIKDIMHKPIFVKDSEILIDVYEKLLAEKTHIAIVRNRRRNFTGVITMEDIIEEILGEIDDERALRKSTK